MQSCFIGFLCAGKSPAWLCWLSASNRVAGVARLRRSPAGAFRGGGRYLTRATGHAHGRGLVEGASAASLAIQGIAQHLRDALGLATRDKGNADPCAHQEVVAATALLQQYNGCSPNLLRCCDDIEKIVHEGGFKEIYLHRTDHKRGTGIAHEAPLIGPE
jgi:hypothetical protein